MEKGRAARASVSLWVVVALGVAASVNGCTCAPKAPRSARERLDRLQAALRNQPAIPESPKLIDARGGLDKIKKSLPPGVTATDPECRGRFCFSTLTYPDRASAERHRALRGSPLADYFASASGRFVIKLAPLGADGQQTVMLGQELEKEDVRFKAESAEDDCTWQVSSKNGADSRRSTDLSAAACAGYLGLNLTGLSASGQANTGDPIWETVFLQPFATSLVFPTTQTPDPDDVKAIVCPVQYAIDENGDKGYQKLKKVCATAHFRNNPSTTTTNRACRIRWVASEVYNGDTGDIITTERVTAAEPVGAGASRVLMGPISDPVDDLGFGDLFRIYADEIAREVYAFDLICTGLDAGDQILRYRFDFDTFWQGF
jgi:hypothetical protein